MDHKNYVGTRSLIMESIMLLLLTLIKRMGYFRKDLSLALLCLSILSGCTILPGMQNLNKNRMPVLVYPNYPIRPTLIPITPGYLLFQERLNNNYKVAPADILAIHVFKHPEFNLPNDINHSARSDRLAGVTGFLVNQQGQIYFPLIGNIQVSGKSVNEIRLIITNKLRTYIPRPQVFVRVSDYRSQKFYVMGEVLKPGLFAMTDESLSLTDALNLAGSFDLNTADPSHIYVIRGNILHPKIYWLNASSPAALLLGEKFQISAGDIVIVSTAAVTRWNRFLNQLLPTLQTVWYTKAITGK